ncbi:ABI gene family member 3 (NESH) binding protein [Cricetulus griseus]
MCAELRHNFPASAVFSQWWRFSPNQRAVLVESDQRLTCKKPNLKVHINTTSDSILLKFLRPNPNVKLEGFLLGYGSNVSPNQYFPLPTEGKVTEAVVDAEPKYLIVVRPAPPPSQKKSCSGKSRSRKPLQLVVGTLTPSSVFLSWGFLINPHHDWTLPSNCPNDRYYTIRYREKDKEKKWIFQLCPATETIVENLKPNTVYEFGVKDNIEGGIWSKIFNHKTIVGMIQNVTHKASTKAPDKTPFGGTILVHLIIPGLNDSMVKLPTSIMLEISDALKAQLDKNETLALPVESKTPEVEKVAAQPVTVLSEKTPETAHSVLIPEFELPLSTLAPPKTKRPGRRPRPKTTRSPESPESKPALEPATVPRELLVPTIDLKPPKQMVPKPKVTPDMPTTKSVATTDIEPVIMRTKAPVTTLAPKPSRPRSRRPRPPKDKATPSPKIPQTKPVSTPVFEPVTPVATIGKTDATLDVRLVAAFYATLLWFVQM